MIRRFALVSCGLLVAALASGCQESCESACRKIIDTCALGVPSYSIEQCTSDCQYVEQQYEAEDYMQPQLDAFHEHLNCIRDASCEDLQANPEQCYTGSETLFVF